MYRIMLFSHDKDTSELRRALWAHRIGHRFTEEAEGQVLWLADPQQHDALMRLLLRWQHGEPIMPDQRVRPASGASLAAVRQAPVTALALGISLLVFALTPLFGEPVILSWMSIVPVVPAGNGYYILSSLAEALVSGQIWRLLSPAFLHFGWMHLAFNMTFFWYLGRQVEVLQGSGRMLLFLLLLGVGANLAQYATGIVLFGGMSGVVYGLLAYVWLMFYRVPSSGFFVPQMLVVFMLGWMLFTMTDMAAAVGFGNVANEAHLGGLIVGLALGWYYSGRARRQR